MRIRFFLYLSVLFRSYLHNWVIARWLKIPSFSWRSGACTRSFWGYWCIVLTYWIKVESSKNSSTAIFVILNISNRHIYDARVSERIKVEASLKANLNVWTPISWWNSREVVWCERAYEMPWYFYFYPFTCSTFYQKKYIDNSEGSIISPCNKRKKRSFHLLGHRLFSRP